MFAVLGHLTGQTFNGSAIMWYMNDIKENRISVKFGTTGINIGGYEGTSLVVKNNVNRKIFIKVRFIITDHCGKETIRNVQESILPNATLGGSTWMGGDEQLDYGTSCKEKTTYNEHYSTKIKSIRFVYAQVREENGKFEPSTDDHTSEQNSGNDTSNISSPIKTGDEPIKLDCPVQELSIAEGPFINCISLRWFTQNVNYTNGTSNEFKQTNIPTEYYLSWRKEGSFKWNEIFIQSNMIKFELTDLEPCTSYEVRIQRNCAKGIRSDFSNVIRFKTTCPTPKNISAIDIKNDMATITAERQTFINYCSPKPISFVSVPEYKSDMSDWEKVFCVWGSPCKLFNLKPSTTYRVRMRYKYGTGMFSEYSNEIVFKTKE